MDSPFDHVRVGVFILSYRFTFGGKSGVLGCVLKLPGRWGERFGNAERV